MNFEDLQPGKGLTYADIDSLFHCSMQGSIRYSSSANALVLIGRGDNNHYIGDPKLGFICFVSFGFAGARSLDSVENTLLRKSNETGLPLFFFRKSGASGYIFVDNVKLAGEPYQVPFREYAQELSYWAFPLHINGIGSIETPLPHINTEIPKIPDLELADSGLSVRAVSVLKNNGITSLHSLLAATPESLQNMKNMSERLYAEIQEFIVINKPPEADNGTANDSVNTEATTVKNSGNGDKPQENTADTAQKNNDDKNAVSRKKSKAERSVANGKNKTPDSESFLTDSSIVFFDTTEKKKRKWIPILIVILALYLVFFKIFYL